MVRPQDLKTFTRSIRPRGWFRMNAAINRDHWNAIVASVNSLSFWPIAEQRAGMSDQAWAHLHPVAADEALVRVIWHKLFTLGHVDVDR
jgi:hypothetical protein